jgi:hypothetical protein
MTLKIPKLLLGCSVLLFTSSISFAATKDPCSLLTPAQIRSAIGIDVDPGKRFGPQIWR